MAQRERDCWWEGAEATREAARAGVVQLRRREPETGPVDELPRGPEEVRTEVTPERRERYEARLDREAEHSLDRGIPMGI